MDQNHVSALREKHGKLERAIAEEAARPNPDTVRLHQLKKRKLRLKESLVAS